jgi:glycosyltransferase involved in cell wall biosynthesis
VASVFVSLSEHEGFGVPLLEALCRGVPVVAFDAAAVRETLDGGGLLLAEKSPATVAAAIETLVRDADVRAAVLASQERSLRHWRAIDPAAVLLERLAPVLAGA